MARRLLINALPIVLLLLLAAALLVATAAALPSRAEAPGGHPSRVASKPPWQSPDSAARDRIRAEPRPERRVRSGRRRPAGPGRGAGLHLPPRDGLRAARDSPLHPPAGFVRTGDHVRQARDRPVRSHRRRRP